MICEQSWSLRSPQWVCVAGTALCIFHGMKKAMASSSSVAQTPMFFTPQLDDLGLKLTRASLYAELVPHSAVLECFEKLPQPCEAAWSEELVVHDRCFQALPLHLAEMPFQYWDCPLASSLGWKSSNAAATRQWNSMEFCNAEFIRIASAILSTSLSYDHLHFLKFIWIWLKLLLRMNMMEPVAKRIPKVS